MRVGMGCSLPSQAGRGEKADAGVTAPRRAHDPQSRGGYVSNYEGDQAIPGRRPVRSRRSEARPARCTAGGRMSRGMAPGAFKCSRPAVAWLAPAVAEGWPLARSGIRCYSFPPHQTFYACLVTVKQRCNGRHGTQPPAPRGYRNGSLVWRISSCIPLRRGRSASVGNHVSWQDKEPCGAHAPRSFTSRADF